MLLPVIIVVFGEAMINNLFQDIDEARDEIFQGFRFLAGEVVEEMQRGAHDTWVAIT